MVEDIARPDHKIFTSTSQQSLNVACDSLPLPTDDLDRETSKV